MGRQKINQIKYLQNLWKVLTRAKNSFQMNHLDGDMKVLVEESADRVATPH